MNNIIELISTVSSKYQLTPEEQQLLTNKYQTDTRDISIIESEVNTYASYYHHQHLQNNIIFQTPPLANGCNYYVMAFDNSSRFILEGVNVTTVNAETNEVLVNNSFKAYQKHTQVDGLEIAICQIGKLLNFDVVEEYQLYNSSHIKDSIIIKDLVNDDEFYDVENLKKRFHKLITSGKIKQEKWMDTYQKLTVANTKEDYVSMIDYGLKILKILPSMLEEDYKVIQQKYFEMILFDSIINQSERKFEDYGIICVKETRRYMYAPLFDNVFPSILKNNDVILFNGITCNRYELMECLFYNYYDQIKDKVNYILTNKDTILKNIDVIAKYNLDLNTYVMLINNVTTNINYMEKLNKERNMATSNKSAGFADVATMGIVLLIIIAFSVAIAYLLYCVK